MEKIMKVRVERDIVHPINNKELFVHCGKSNMGNTTLYFEKTIKPLLIIHGIEEIEYIE